jgi:hypothetical protein
VDLYDRSSAGNKMHFKIQRAGNYTRPWWEKATGELYEYECGWWTYFWTHR